MPNLTHQSLLHGYKVEIQLHPVEAGESIEQPPPTHFKEQFAGPKYSNTVSEGKFQGALALLDHSQLCLEVHSPGANR